MVSERPTQSTNADASERGDIVSCVLSPREYVDTRRRPRRARRHAGHARPPRRGRHPHGGTCAASSRPASCAPSSTPMRRRSSASGSMPATVAPATCGAGRSTSRPATSSRWPPWAPTMPDGRTIGRRGILGIDSEGMLCSARELGLGDDHSGILVLPEEAAVGVPYGEVLGRRDEIVLDVDVTRNRPDCQSYVGVARDLAAKLGVPFTPPAPPAVERVRRRRRRRPPSTIVDGDRCGRFTSTVLTGVVVGPVGVVDGRAADGGRDAPDQQRRRCQQLRDARAGPAQPRL